MKTYISIVAIVALAAVAIVAILRPRPVPTGYQRVEVVPAAGVYSDGVFTMPVSVLVRTSDLNRLAVMGPEVRVLVRDSPLMP